MFCCGRLNVYEKEVTLSCLASQKSCFDPLGARALLEIQLDPEPIPRTLPPTLIQKSWLLDRGVSENLPSTSISLGTATLILFLFYPKMDYLKHLS
jgi:hypothetical protein